MEPDRGEHLGRLGGGDPSSWEDRPGFLRRIWRLYISGNPLMAHEMGFAAGPRRWKSPMLWALVFALLAALWPFVQNLVMGISWERLVEREDYATEILFFVFGAVTLVLSICYGLLPLYFSARTWHRDLQPEMREQLSITMINPRQLIGAKTLVWLLPGLVNATLSLALGLLGTLVMLLTPMQLPPGYEHFAAIQVDPLWRAVLIIGILGFGFISSIGYWLLALCFTASNSLRGRNPILSVVMTVLYLIGCGLLIGILTMVGGMLSNLITPNAALLVSPALMLILVWLLVFSFWRRLPPRVAAVFGPQE